MESNYQFELMSGIMFLLCVDIISYSSHQLIFFFEPTIVEQVGIWKLRIDLFKKSNKETATQGKSSRLRFSKSLGVFDT